MLELLYANCERSKMELMWKNLTQVVYIRISNRISKRVTVSGNRSGLIEKGWLSFPFLDRLLDTSKILIH